jgi:hypothetical protein
MNNMNNGHDNYDIPKTIAGTTVLAHTSSRIPITREEFGLMRAAAPIYANLPSPRTRADESWEDPRKTQLPKLGVRWRELVEPLAQQSGFANSMVWMASRLVETYAAAYPGLEDEGKVDGWGGGEARSNLLTICFAFAADEDQKWRFAREAMEAFG